MRFYCYVDGTCARARARAHVCTRAKECNIGGLVCFRGGKAPTRRNLGEASLFSFVMARDADWLAGGPRKLSEPGRIAAPGLKLDSESD